MAAGAPRPRWYATLPPFFTLQPVRDTRTRQMKMWASWILDYCKAEGIQVLDVVEQADSALFHNRELDRRLSVDDAKTVVQEGLVDRGLGEWVGDGRLRIHWRTVDEWGDLLLAYVRTAGLDTSVCTVHELLHGDETAETEFHGMDRDVFMHVLEHLQDTRDACVVMPADDEAMTGVKFTL